MMIIHLFILSSAAQMYEFSYIHFHLIRNDQLPVGLIDQLIEHCTGIAEVMASNPIHEDRTKKKIRRKCCSARDGVLFFFLTRPPTLALPHFRACPKRRTSDRRLLRAMIIHFILFYSFFIPKLKCTGGIFFTFTKIRKALDAEVVEC